MMKDYLLDENDDLVIQGGDFKVGESTEQHKSLLLRLQKGELRQFPKTGVGLADYLLDESPNDLWLEIQKQFEADGMVVRKINFIMDEGINKMKPDIDAFYP